MAKLPRFDPPAFLNDLTEEQKADWSKFISSYFTSSICVQESEIGRGNCQFYNPLVTDTPEEHEEAPIFWPAFPNVLKKKFEGNELQAYVEAEKLQTDNNISYRVQDEYCEWHVERDEQTSKIKRVTFTCEGPEYWQFLGKVNRQKVVDLYRTYVSSRVEEEELFPQGIYNPYNVWNTERGAMHLTHPSNTLGAEIRLAADATVLRKDRNGRILTRYDELIKCGNYGEPQRSSDPQIGGKVNDSARQHAFITLRNPVGLYIESLDTSGWKTPNGKDAQTYWRIVRGQVGQGGKEVLGVRAVFEIPPEEGFTVSDILIGTQPINHGGQIADNITMKLVGIACRHGEIVNEPHSCRNPNFHPSCFGEEPIMFAESENIDTLGSAPETRNFSSEKGMK
ncbi:hypothetical protein [Bacillus thuringiensis]|uniref:hypothetical protein n=1 Tax=Bacillus thuringiensis TaxID=1428 RepID=UPI000BED89D0|nr:hypothetical protein [Bacillus thuringiensis]PDZ59279.1 hypothetical protein CON29_24915 [Bacillus thuringiensis]